MKAIILLLWLCAVISTPVLSQTTWVRTYGGSGEDNANGIAYAADGGFAVVGSTSSNTGDFDGRNKGSDDIFITRFDASGEVLWTRVIGGSKADHGLAIARTTDGGWIITGSTESTDGDFQGIRNGLPDVVVIKLKNDGSIDFTSVLGGSYVDVGKSIISEEDGSCIVAGYTASIDGDLGAKRHGFFDAFAVKIDGNGTIVWKGVYGGTSDDLAQSIVKVEDGSYAIAGHTESNDGDFSGLAKTGSAAASQDAFVIKINSDGSLRWSKLFGGNGDDFGKGLAVSPTGLLALAGYTNSKSGDFADLGVVMIDMFLITIAPSGDLVWAKRFGGTRYDHGYAVSSAPNSGWMLTGEALSPDGMFQGMSRGGGSDVYVIRVDQYGDVVWKRSIGGEWYERGASIIPTNNGCLVSGSTDSDDGDFLGTNRGNNDLFVAALDSNGNLGTTSVMDAKSEPLSSIAVYPNPASSSLTISYSIGLPTTCRLELIDRLGTVVFSTDLGLMDPGTHTLPIVTSSIASGFYIARMWVGGEAVSTPFIAVR